MPVMPFGGDCVIDIVDNVRSGRLPDRSFFLRKEAIDIMLDRFCEGKQQR